VLLLAIATAALVVSAACAAAALPFRRAADSIAAGLLVGCADVVVLILIMGAVLRDLRPVPLTIAAFIVATAQGAAVVAAGGLDTVRGKVGAAPAKVSAVAARSPRHPLVLVLAVLVLAQYLWRAALGSRMPEVDWDGLWYHLVGPDVWIQNHAITHVPQSIWADVYPADQELLTTWVGTFLHTVRFAWASQLPFVALGMTACAGIARHIGARRAHAALAGVAFGAIPAVFVQGATSYTDVAAAATALAVGQMLMSAAAVRERGNVLVPLVMAGVAAGLGIGVKSSNLLVLLLAVPFVAVVAYRAHGRSLRTLAALAGAGVPVLALGSFWYARTWADYGNPFYPFTMLGFQGEGTIKNLIMDRSTLPALRHDSVLHRVLVSWQGDLTRHEVAYDVQIGGFGLQWPLLLLPAIAVATVLLVRRRRWDFLAAVALPAAATLAASPGPWWPRYLIVLPAFGSICLAFVLTETAAGGKAVMRRFAGFAVPGFVALAAVSMWWATSPTQYLVHDRHGSAVRALSFRAAAKLVVHPDSRVSIYRSTEFRTIRRLPAGSAIAVVGPAFEFVHPLIGDGLTRRAVRITAADTPGALANAMRPQHAAYVLLAGNGTEKGLYTLVAHDSRTFRRMTVGGPVFGSDLFELTAP
jgi:hypothetical protein